jgi:phosphate transport system permease protein
VTTTTPEKTSTTAPARPAPSERAITRRDIVPTIVALLGALCTALLCWNTLGWHSFAGVALVTLLAFVGLLVLAEVVFDKPANTIDLVAIEREESGQPEPEPAKPARPLKVVRDEFDGAPEDDRPRKRRTIRGVDVAEALVAVLAGLAIAELVRVIIKMQSLVGFGIWWYMGFLAVYFILVRDRNDIEAAIDRIVAVIVWSMAILVAAVLTWMVGFLVVKGLRRLSWHFFTEDLSKTGPLTPGGGAKHAWIGTLVQVGIATVIVVPIAVMTAVYLNEINGRLARPIRFITEAMSGLPSIVAGLLVFTVVVQDHGFSGLAGAIALAILMLPTVTRTSEEILRTVPDTLREGSLALGAPRWRLVQRVVLPTALAGLVTAVILGVARAIGETAPMLLTAFGSDSTNISPTNGPQSDLPLMVWKLIREPVDAQQQRAFTGALVLVMIVFVLFVIARYIAGRNDRRLRRAS